MREYTEKRNTPTCVGKTDEVVAMGAAIQKHPHVRGEDGKEKRRI